MVGADARNRYCSTQDEGGDFREQHGGDNEDGGEASSRGSDLKIWEE